jgi:hypothetical protein
MNGFDNPAYLTGWFVSNIIGLFMLYTAARHVRLTRFLFFLVFAWACWMNWKTAILAPEDYQEYAKLSFIPFYRNFIRGWFHDHTLVVVGTIATAQALIAFSMLLKGWIFRTGLIGGMVFLVAVVPLGIGAGFPTTLTLATALYLVLRKGEQDFLWKRNSKP